MRKRTCDRNECTASVTHIVDFDGYTRTPTTTTYACEHHARRWIRGWYMPIIGTISRMHHRRAA